MGKDKVFDKNDITDETWDFARHVHDKNLGAKGDTVDDIALKLHMGMEVGLPPMAADKNIAVINGDDRRRIWGSLLAEIVEKSGLQENYKEEEIGARNPDGTLPDDFGYRYTTTRKDGEPYSSEFTVADAKEAGRWGKGPWVEYPERLLVFRARMDCLHAAYAKALIPNEEEC